MQGIVTNIQRYSLNDGQGIRTVTFLKGCPLRCLWCSNPETQQAKPQIMFHATKCTGCQECRQACPENLDLPANVDPGRCRHCGACADACPTTALELSGKEMTVDAVLDIVQRDRQFYSEGGGLTLSGGEPLVQWEFAAALAKKASEVHHLHVAIETTGHAKWEHLLVVTKYCDQVLFDIKHMDAERHNYGTNIGNESIIQNLRKLAAIAADKITIRIPLIDGYNADPENIGRVCELGKELGLKEIHLLPYHKFGEPKYAKLGLEYVFDGKTPDDQTVEDIRRYLEENGYRVEIGG